MSKKNEEYTTAATRFFGLKETVELELDENENELEIEDTNEFENSYEEEYDVDEYDDDEYDDEEYDDEEFEYDDDYEYDDNFEKHPKNRATLIEEQKAKKRKTKFIVFGISLGVILVALIAIIYAASRTEYIETLDIYVDGVLVKTLSNVEPGNVDNAIVTAGYDTATYKVDEKQPSTESKKYLVQKKEISVTYAQNNWTNEKKTVYQYTLGNVLTELEIDLNENSTVYLDNSKISEDKFATTTVRTGSLIKIVDTNTETVEEIVEVPFTTIQKNDSSIPIGETVVQTVGVNGSKKIIYSVSYVNGEEVDRTIISSDIITEPVDEVILIGTKPQDIDTDGDGVFDQYDKCSNTPKNEKANADGCSPSQLN